MKKKEGEHDTLNRQGNSLGVNVVSYVVGWMMKIKTGLLGKSGRGISAL